MLVVVLQSDLAADLQMRIVAPLIPASELPTAARGLNPGVLLGDTLYRLKPELMAAVPLSELSRRIASVAHQRDDITRALDLLFTGI
jgi:toxin CcdB